MVQAGQADYDGDVPPAKLSALTARYGPGSAAARAGRQQLYANSAPGVWFLALNTSRPLFASVNLRKAVNYAIDRRALIRHHPYALEPTDQYLPPAAPGYRDAHIYPLDHSDLLKARRLAGGHGGQAVMYTCPSSDCAERAQIVKEDLKAIGIEVEVRQFANWVEKVGTKGEPFDIVDAGWINDYLDPRLFLNSLDGSKIKAKNNGDWSYLDDPVFNRRLAAAAKLTGPKRYRVYGRLDVDLAREAAPFIAYATWAYRDFFSARMGCQVFQPIYGMDLGALCVRKKK